MSAPSEKATIAVACVVYDADDSLRTETAATNYAKTILEAAHTPALGLDRSVCLRDVVDALPDSGTVSVSWLRANLERRFTEGEGA